MSKNIHKTKIEKEQESKALEETNVATAIADPEIKKEVVQETAVVSKVNPLKDSGKDEGYNLQIVEDHDGKIDRFFIPKKDPQYEYRFLNTNGSNLSLKTHGHIFDKGGWQICPKEHCLAVGLSEDKLDVDGHYRVIDTVLARMPIEYFAKKEKHKQKKASGQMERVDNLIKKGDPGAEKGVHETFQGLQTGKALGMK